MSQEKAPPTPAEIQRQLDEALADRQIEGCFAAWGADYGAVSSSVEPA